MTWHHLLHSLLPILTCIRARRAAVTQPTPTGTSMGSGLHLILSLQHKPLPYPFSGFPRRWYSGNRRLWLWRPFTEFMHGFCFFFFSLEYHAFGEGFPLSETRCWTRTVFPFGSFALFAQTWNVSATNMLWSSYTLFCQLLHKVPEVWASLRDLLIPHHLTSLPGCRAFPYWWGVPKPVLSEPWLSYL